MSSSTSLTTFVSSAESSQTILMAPWCSGYHYCTPSFNKSWTQILCRFKSCSRRVEHSRWWGSLTMVPAGNKAKCLSSVNHTTKIINSSSSSSSSSSSPRFESHIGGKIGINILKKFLRFSFFFNFWLNQIQNFSGQIKKIKVGTFSFQLKKITSAKR